MVLAGLISVSFLGLQMAAFALCPHTAFFLCYILFFLWWHQSYWIWVPLRWPHLTLITSSKAPSASTVTFGFSLWILGEQNSTHNSICGEVCCSSCLVLCACCISFPVGFFQGFLSVFDFFFLCSLNEPCLSVDFLAVFLLGILSFLDLWFGVINFRKFLSIITSNILFLYFLFLLHSFFLEFVFPLCICYSFHNCLCSWCFICQLCLPFFSLCILIWEVSINSLQDHRFSPWPCQICWLAHQRHSSFLLQCFWF